MRAIAILHHVEDLVAGLMVNREIDDATKLQTLEDLAAVNRRITSYASEFERDHATGYEQTLRDAQQVLRATPGVLDEIARRSLAGGRGTTEDLVDVLRLDQIGGDR